MDFLLRAIQVLPGADWLALAGFVIGWVGYVQFARRRGLVRRSVLGSTNRIREAWMLECTRREVRIVDSTVLQNLSSSPSFFASTTILVIGGLAAALGATEKATELVQELPFAARTSALVMDLKLLLLLGVYVHAFFRFTWAMRQYTFGALMIGAAPDRSVFAADEPARLAYAHRAARVMGLAAETFNDGLRAIYFSFAALLWFLSPLALVLGTASVIWVLFRREFHSEILAVLAEAPGALAPAPAPAPGPASGPTGA
jgi:uncharacterized membrane protein